MKAWICFFAILLYAKPLTIEGSSLFIIWNIGQGQWVTAIEDHYCLHFDIGGERLLYPTAVNTFCDRRHNLLNLSHLDHDHTLWLARQQMRWQNFCLINAPPRFFDETKDSQLRLQTAALIQKFTTCLSRPWAHLFVWQPNPIQLMGRQKKTLTSNDLSTVTFFDRFLLPGDATKMTERHLLLQQKSRLAKVEVLLAGHHGSQTSTSHELLNQLKNLKFVVISARERRYGHPHPDVLLRLKLQKKPWLRTEDWGHIAIEF